MLELNYNKKFHPPSPEVLRLLELSRKEVEGMGKRTLKCPVCGFRIDGVYAAGDVCIKPLRQIVTATGDGALAAFPFWRKP